MEIASFSFLLGILRLTQYRKDPISYPDKLALSGPTNSLSRHRCPENLKIVLLASFKDLTILFCFLYFIFDI